MSDQETLKITITADNKSAIEGLKQVSTATQSFVTAQGKLVTGSKQAAQALTNVGRVAQDLPFGFIGIQNNLNPLLESFQRLKVETGSTKGALTALGSSLIGAGGIGLALSVASSAFLLFQNGMAGFGKKAKEAKKELDAFTESLSQNREAASKDLSTMRAYVSAAQNTALSVEQRQIAVNKLLQQYPEYFKGLTVENALTKDLTQQTNSLTEAIYKRAAARAMESDIAASATEVFREQEKLEKVRLNIEKAQADLAKQRKAPTQIGGGGSLGGISGGTVSGVEVAERSVNALLVQQEKILTNIDQKKFSIAQKQLKINALTAETINLDAKDNKPKTYGEAKQKLNLEDFHGKQKYADAVQIQQHLLDVQKEMLAVSQKQYEVDVKKEALIRLGKPIMDGKFQGVQNTALAAGLDQKEAENKQRLLGIEQSRLDVIANINNKFKEQKALAESIGGAFQNLFQNIANGANPFETLSNAVKQLVVDLAAAAAKMFLIKAIMTAINPAAGAAKGAGGILGSLIGGITPFATGGIVSRPTLGMVGEAGTEAILPLDRFQGMLAQSFQMGSVSGNGGGTQTVVLDTQVRGNDLWFIQRRTDFNRGLKTGG